MWPKENPFPYLYSSIEKYIKSNTEKSFLKTLKFHKVKKISYVLRALPNEIKGGIATSLIFSAWNAAVYVNQMTDEQIFIKICSSVIWLTYTAAFQAEKIKEVAIPPFISFGRALKT